MKVALAVAGMLAFAAALLYFGHIDWKGRRIAAGDACFLQASPQGDAIAWLQGCKPPKGSEALCEAYVFAEGAVSKVADRVRLRDGVRFGPDGRLGAIANANPATGTGELRIWSRQGGTRSAAAGVNAFDLGPEGLLVYLADGRASLASDGGIRTIRAAQLRSIAAVGVGSKPWVAIALGGKGEMLGIDAEGRSISLAGAVDGYRISRSGRYAAVLTGEADGRRLLAVTLGDGRRARTLGSGVRSFVVADEADSVAFVAEASEGPGLYVADLGEDKKRRVGAEPTEYRWAREAAVLGWIAKADDRLFVAGRTEEIHELHLGVAEFDLASDGSTVAYATRARELFVADLGAKPSKRITGEAGTFRLTPRGHAVVVCYGLRPDGCALGICYPPHDDDACSMLTGYGRRFFTMDEQAPAGSIRLVATTNRSPIFLTAFSRGMNVHVGESVDTESVLFLPPDGRRVAYIGRADGREGVFIADLGDWGLPETPPPKPE